MDVLIKLKFDGQYSHTDRNFIDPQMKGTIVNGLTVNCLCFVVEKRTKIK